MMKGMQDFVQHNLGMKIVALVAAMGIWVFVMNDQNPVIEGNFTVPISQRNLPEGYDLTMQQEVIRIGVKAPRSAFVATSEKEFQAFVDLSGIVEGAQQVKVQTVLPSGFEMSDNAPIFVQVIADKYIESQMTAEILQSGVPLQGWVVDKEKMRQGSRTVTVTGPRSAVSRVQRVVGELNVDGHGADFRASIPIFARDDKNREVQEVQVVPSAIEMDVKLARSMTKKILPVKPIVESDVAEGWEVVSVKVTPEKLEIVGDAVQLGALAAAETEKISLKEVKESGDIQAKLALPEGIQAPSVPIVVHVELKLKGTEKTVAKD